MKTFSVLLFCLVSALWLSTTGRGASAAEAGAIREAAEAVLSDSRFQRSLPAAPEAARAQGQEPETWTRRQGSGERSGGSGFRFSLIDGLDPVLSTLGWVLIIVLAVILVLVLMRRIAVLNAGKTGARRPAARTEALPHSGPQAAPSLAQAEALAAEGRFAEAIHLLLATLIALLRQRVDPALAVSLTSREIHQRVPLPGEAGAAFIDLVTAVEVSHFGGRAVDEAAFRLCRSHFERAAAAAEGGRP